MTGKMSFFTFTNRTYLVKINQYNFFNFYLGVVMKNNNNTTEVVNSTCLDNEDINVITIVGEFKTVVETTIEIHDQGKFLSLFPDAEFDEDTFINLLTSGKIKEGSILSIIDQEFHESGLRNYEEVYELSVE
jgi:hypothetical protein